MSGKALASDSEDDERVVAPVAVKKAPQEPPAKKVRHRRRLRATRRRENVRSTDDFKRARGITQAKTAPHDAKKGKAPAPADEDDDDESGDSDADSVDSECVDNLSGDEVDASNIIPGGRASRRGRPTTFTADMYAKAGAFGSDSDDE